MRIAFVVLCTLFVIRVIAQKEIKIEDAKDHIGDSVKLSGEAYGMRYLETSGTTMHLSTSAKPIQEKKRLQASDLFKEFYSINRRC
jgi:hypothetical protein